MMSAGATKRSVTRRPASGLPRSASSPPRNRAGMTHEAKTATASPPSGDNTCEVKSSGSSNTVASAYRAIPPSE